MDMKFITKIMNMQKVNILALIVPLLGGVGGGLFTSCSDFFETDSDRQVFDPALDQKTDSMFYTLGILKGLQEVADQYVLTGEMRGDLVKVNNYTETDLKRLADFTADATCKYDSAYKYYRIINNCNYYIAHRDTTLVTGNRKVAIPEYAEALAVRAWAYMQLCKNYGEVPFFTQPLTSISDANMNFEKKNLQGICDALSPEMERYSGTPVPSYGDISAGVLNSSSSDNPEEKMISSRKAMLPIDVVLGDLYLETHQYEQAARSYYKYISNNNLNTNGIYIPSRVFYPETSSSRLPNDITYTVFNSTYSANTLVTSNSVDYWSSIFSINSPIDVVTYIPLAANRLRGTVTELPRYFGYDFYSTTGGGASSSSRYLLERQIDASDSLLALSNRQLYYYMPVSSTTNTKAKELSIGDLRRHVYFTSASKGDSVYSVMNKFTSANIPLYRTAAIYLRLAEAFNRMGYPDAAFLILKDGINPNIVNNSANYVQPGGWANPTNPTIYLRPETYTLLRTTFPFLSSENVLNYNYNSGIHSRGCNYTFGTFSPYQMDSVVTEKMAYLKRVYGASYNPTGTLADTINAVEDIICDEMALELGFEGSRFNDLTRIAKHKNQDATYGGDFGTQWFARKLGYKADGLEQRLLNEQHWYLPFK